MSNKPTLSNLRNEHQLIFPKCELLCKEVIRQIEFMVDSKNIILAFPIQFRAKTFDSIQSKMDDGRYNIKKSILELQDLAGIRIITLFKRDANDIIDILKDKLSIQNIYNTQDKLDDSEFGYSSTHLVCALKDEWLSIPSFSELNEIKFEIQVRTVSQHSWAEVSNKLQYKKNESVPKPLKRAISRISALLEIVDNEFENLLQDREEYVTNIDIKLFNNESLVLNVDNLKQILHQKIPKRFIINDEDFASLLNELQSLNYDSESLIKLIDKHLEKSLEEDSKVCDGLRKLYKIEGDFAKSKYYVSTDTEEVQRILAGTFYSSVGLLRIMLEYEFGEKALKEIRSKNK